MPAFLPREKPISRKAKPACMKNTRTVATITQVMSSCVEHLRLGALSVLVLGEGRRRESQEGEQRQWHRSGQTC